MKQLKRDMDYIIQNIVCRNSIECLHDDAKKRDKAHEREYMVMTNLVIDLKTAMSACRVSINEMMQKVIPYSDCVDSLLTYTHRVEALSESVDINSEEIKELRHSINQMLEHQKRIMEFLETQDKINQDLICIVEAYAPIRKVPKLPKTKAATTANS